jgi:hypothetical protein
LPGASGKAARAAASAEERGSSLVEMMEGGSGVEVRIGLPVAMGAGVRVGSGVQVPKDRRRALATSSMAGSGNVERSAMRSRQQTCSWTFRPLTASKTSQRLMRR